MNSNCFLLVTQWDLKVAQASTRASRETLVPQNCVMFLNIPPLADETKIRAIITGELKKLKKYNETVLFDKSCSEFTVKKFSVMLRNKLGTEKFFNLGTHKILGVTNVTSLNEIGIIQNEPKMATA